MMSFPEKWTSNNWTIRNFKSSVFSSKFYFTFCCTFSSCRHNTWYSKHKPVLLTSAPSFHPGVPFCTQANFRCEGGQLLVNCTLIFVIFPGFCMMQDEPQTKLRKRWHLSLVPLLSLSLNWPLCLKAHTQLSEDFKIWEKTKKRILQNDNIC